MPRKSVLAVDTHKPAGKKPGVRGPARSAKEKAESRVIVVKETLPAKLNTSGLRRGNPGNNPHIPSARKLKLAKQLSDLIREIGDETIDSQKGWTRIEAVVRRLYSDALSGKTPAQALLFERGWGRVPTPVQLDLRAEVSKLIETTGLTAEELDGDPILKELIGNVVEGSYREADAGTGNAAG